jgi:hypothetical protein
VRLLVDDPQMRRQRSEVPWWILAVMFGVPFGVGMGLFTKSDGSSWAEAGVGAIVTGIPFGLAMGWWTIKWRAGIDEAEGDLPADKVKLAHRAAVRGPIPVDADVRSAALSLASLQLAQYAGKIRRLTIVMVALAFVISLIGAVTDSLSALEPALLFGVVLLWHWYRPRQIRRRIGLLSGTTTASSD